MTNDEIATMSRAVARHFGLWTPKQCVQPRTVSDSTKTWCERCGWETKPTLGARPYSIPHEIPCPDLTQPEWAWRLLKEFSYVKWISGGGIACDLWIRHNGKEGHGIADTLGHALLLAAYQLVPREAAK